MLKLDRIVAALQAADDQNKLDKIAATTCIPEKKLRKAIRTKGKNLTKFKVMMLGVRHF